MRRLAECVTETQRDIAASGLLCPIVGHVGDGNFHCSPLVDMDNPAEVRAARMTGRACQAASSRRQGGTRGGRWARS